MGRARVVSWRNMLRSSSRLTGVASPLLCFRPRALLCSSTCIVFRSTTVLVPLLGVVVALAFVKIHVLGSTAPHRQETLHCCAVVWPFYCRTHVPWQQHHDLLASFP